MITNTVSSSRDVRAAAFFSPQKVAHDGLKSCAPGRPAGPVGRARDSGSQGGEFEPHVGRTAYLK